MPDPIDLSKFELPDSIRYVPETSEESSQKDEEALLSEESSASSEESTVTAEPSEEVFMKVDGVNYTDAEINDILPGAPALMKIDGKRFESKLAPGETFFLAPLDRVDADLFDKMLFWCKSKNASDVSLRSGDYLRAESGGAWRRVSARPISENEVDAVIRKIVGDSAPGSLKRGNEIDQPYQPRDENQLSHRFRMNITCIKHPIRETEGFELVLRSLPTDPPLPSEIGVEQVILDSFRVEKGVNLITGPTGSGKSTLLYSLIRHEMEKPGACDHILDYSRPIEYTISNIELDSFISQMEVGLHLRDPDNNSESAQWQRAVRNALRRKPNLIIIGESRDLPTFNAVLQSAQSGHLTTTTLHTNSVPSTIQRALRFYPHDERIGVAMDLMGSLNLVVCQRLFPHANGKRKIAVKEYMVFNNYVKSVLIRMPNLDAWPTWLYENMSKVEQMENPPFICQTMMAHAKRLLDAGEITEDTYEVIANEQMNFSELKEGIGPQVERDEPDQSISPAHFPDN